MTQNRFVQLVITAAVLACTACETGQRQSSAQEGSAARELVDAEHVIEVRQIDPGTFAGRQPFGHLPQIWVSMQATPHSGYPDWDDGMWIRYSRTGSTGNFKPIGTTAADGLTLYRVGEQSYNGTWGPDDNSTQEIRKTLAASYGSDAGNTVTYADFHAVKYRVGGLPDLSFGAADLGPFVKNGIYRVVRSTSPSDEPVAWLWRPNNKTNRLIWVYRVDDPQNETPNPKWVKPSYTDAWMEFTFMKSTKTLDIDDGLGGTKYNQFLAWIYLEGKADAVGVPPGEVKTVPDDDFFYVEQ